MKHFTSKNSGGITKDASFQVLSLNEDRSHFFLYPSFRRTISILADLTFPLVKSVNIVGTVSVDCKIEIPYRRLC